VQQQSRSPSIFTFYPSYVSGFGCFHGRQLVLVVLFSRKLAYFVFVFLFWNRFAASLSDKVRHGVWQRCSLGVCVWHAG